MPHLIVKYASGINIVLHKHQVAHIVLAVNILMMIRVTKPTMIARTIVQYVVKENIAQAIQTLHAKIVPAENIYQMMPKMLVVTIMLMIALRVQVVNSKTVQVKVNVQVALVVNI